MEIAGPALSAKVCNGEREDAGADDHRDAEDDEVPRAEVVPEPVAGLVGIGHRLLDGLVRSKGLLIMLLVGVRVVLAELFDEVDDPDDHGSRR